MRGLDFTDVKIVVGGGGEPYHLAELRARRGALERSGQLEALGVTGKARS